MDGEANIMMNSKAQQGQPRVFLRKIKTSHFIYKLEPNNEKIKKSQIHLAISRDTRRNNTQMKMATKFNVWHWKYFSLDYVRLFLYQMRTDLVNWNCRTVARKFASKI